MPRSDESISSPYSVVRTTSDPLEAAASLLRFVDETTSRTVQPGQGRRAEHGVITSGRVIPTANDCDAAPSSSSRQGVGNTSETASTSSSRKSPRLNTPVKRTIRRKLGVLSPSRTLKSDGVGMEERSKVIQRLLNEARFLRRNALPYCFLSPRSDNVFQWTAVLEGPHGTVYEGGTFFCNIHFTMSYPEMPPKVEFLTRIYHCNVNAQGEVSIDILNTKWKPSMSICTVRSALMSLFYSCNPDEALVASIGKEYRENRDEFDRMARIWTLRYAV